MIFVRAMGQLGNQMFQYCIGHIAARISGHEYRPDRWRTKFGAPLTWSGLPYLKQEIHPGIGVSHDGTSYTVPCAHWLDLPLIPTDGDVMLRGYFQRYELIKPHKTLVRDNLLKIHHKLLKGEPDTVVIHVRRTDYAVDGDSTKQCLAHTLEEYGRCLDAFGPGVKRLVLVSDDYNDPFLREFRQFGLPVYYGGGPWDHDFLLMASAYNLIISQSTFSWWAGFLGTAVMIACPLTQGSHWHRGAKLFGAPPRGEPDYPNLIVDDEPGRWVWCD